MELRSTLRVHPKKLSFWANILQKQEYILFGMYIVLSTIVFPYLNIGFVTTRVFVPMFVIYYFVRSEKVYFHKLLILFFVFFLWSIFSSLFADDLRQVVLTESRLFMTVLQCFIIFRFVKKSKVKLIYALRLVTFCFILYFVLIVYNGSISLYSGDIFRLDPQENELLNNELLADTNNFGYFCYSGLSALALLYFITKNSWNMILFLIFSTLSYQLIQFTASRGSLIILGTLISSVIVLYVLFFYNNYFKVFYIIGLVCGALFMNDYFTSTMSDTILGKRFLQLENTESPRQLHSKEAFKIGLNNPFLGVGGGNYAVQPRDFERGSFSHNTYAECFANYGFPGIICLLIFYGYFFTSLFRKLINSKRYLFPLVIMVIFLCYNIFYVSYLTMDFMTIFVLNGLSLQIEE